MSDPSQLGRNDQQAAPLLGRNFWPNVIMAGMVLGGFLMWHLAVVITARGVAITDLQRTALAWKPKYAIAGVGADTFKWFAGLVIALIVGSLVLLFWSAARQGKRNRYKGLATEKEIRDGLGEKKARDKASQSRQDLSSRERASADVSEIGLPLGSSRGQDIVLPLEANLLTLTSTGGGKTARVMIPAGLTAPGMLVVTTTRTDIIDLLVTEREKKGRVWVFDPLNRVGWTEQMVFDPVGGSEDGEKALSRGLAFAGGLGADGSSEKNSSFFRRAAASTLTYLLHSAALDGRSIGDVIDWGMGMTDGAVEAQEIIRSSADPRVERMWAGMLRSRATGADETVSSTRQTLQESLEPMSLRKVLQWVTPAPGARLFRPAEFVRSTDTLFLVCDDNASTNVAPLCSMLLQEIFDEFKAYALQTKGKRVFPTGRILGDEIANVAPVPKLPNIASDARGYGLQLVLALQSLSAAQQRWGKAGTDTLLSNMNAQLLLPGITDPDTLKRYSSLVGDVEISRSTTNFDPYTGRSTGSAVQTADRAVMRGDEIRRMPDGKGLLIYANQPAMMLDLPAWFEGRNAKHLEKAALEVEAERLAYANARP